METVIIENVRGQWIVDKSSTKVFEEKVGYRDGALIELGVVKYKSLCCHPSSPTVCSHNIKVALLNTLEEGYKVMAKENSDFAKLAFELQSKVARKIPYFT